MPDSPFQPEKHIGSSIYKGPLQIPVLESMVQRAIKGTRLRYRWKENVNDIPTSDIDEIARSLFVFWQGISEVFAKHWGKRPKEQHSFCALGLYTMILFYDKLMQDIDTNSADAVLVVKTRLDPIKDIPWDKMRSIPATVKAFFRPENLFDAITSLWQQNGKRPSNWQLLDPQTQVPLVDLELGG